MQWHKWKIDRQYKSFDQFYGWWTILVSFVCYHLMKKVSIFFHSAISHRDCLFCRDLCLTVLVFLADICFTFVIIVCFAFVFFLFFVLFCYLVCLCWCVMYMILHDMIWCLPKLVVCCIICCICLTRFSEQSSLTTQAAIG